MTVASVNTEGPRSRTSTRPPRSTSSGSTPTAASTAARSRSHVCDDRGVAPGAERLRPPGGRRRRSSRSSASFTFMADASCRSSRRPSIAWFGTCCAGTPSGADEQGVVPDRQQPHVRGRASRSAPSTTAARTSTRVIIDGAQPFIPLMENAMKRRRHEVRQRAVILPATARTTARRSPRRPSGGADCVIMVVSETPYIAWMTPWAQSGTEARMYGPQGNLNAVVDQGQRAGRRRRRHRRHVPRPVHRAVGGLPRRARGSTTPTRRQDYNSLGGMGTWAAYTAFTQIVEDDQAATSTAQVVPRGRGDDVEPRPGRAWCRRSTSRRSGRTRPEGYDRLFNRCVVFSQLKDGKVVPLTDGVRGRQRRWRSGKRASELDSTRSPAPGSRPGPGPVPLDRRCRLVEEFIRFALLGFGIGALYALASQGLIVDLPRLGRPQLRARRDRAWPASTSSGSCTSSRGGPFLAGARRRRRRRRPPLGALTHLAHHAAAAHAPRRSSA